MLSVVGAAYIVEKGIATFLTSVKTEIPEYLDTFPILMNPQDINKFIAEYNNDRQLAKSLTEEWVKTASVRGADKFIINLKERLGQ